MPIYAYRCATCGHAKDVLQKLADAPLTVCPACQAGTFVKQVTAAGFQLKGSGWYATDFKGGAKPAGEKVSTPDATQTDAPAKPPGDAAPAATPGATPAAAAGAPAAAASVAAPAASPGAS